MAYWSQVREKEIKINNENYADCMPFYHAYVPVCFIARFVRFCSSKTRNWRETDEGFFFSVLDLCTEYSVCVEFAIFLFLCAFFMPLIFDIFNSFCALAHHFSSRLSTHYVFILLNELSSMFWNDVPFCIGCGP